MNLDNEKEVIDYLMQCADTYYNSDITLISDEEFDQLYLEASTQWPNNPFFNKIGSPVRGAEIKHTNQIGGLEQVHPDELDKWKNRSNYKNETLLATEKLDGSSITLSYVNGQLNTGYTRGDGITGADVTRHVTRMTHCIPKQINVTQEIVEIRGEFIIKKENFDKVKEILLQVSGKEYKNLRGIANGLINNKVIPEEIIPYLDFVAYGLNIDNDQLDNLNLLKDNKFLTPKHFFITSSALNESALNEVLLKTKESSIYELDGIVIEFSDNSIRKQLGIHKSTCNPKYAFKWKMTDESNKFQATVKYVEWNLSKHGLAKPTIVIFPIEHNGITIERFSGFNAKYVKDNKIGPGTIVKAYRAGDVIPYIEKVISSNGDWQKPENVSLYKWSETEVELELIDKSENEEVIFKQLRDFFSQLGVEFIGDATIQSFIDLGYDTLEDIISLPITEWEFNFGKNGSKGYQSLHSILKNVYKYQLLGSYPYFGSGFGKRKAKALLEELGDNYIIASKEQIVAIKGFEEKSAKIILAGMPRYIQFLEWLQKNNYVQFISDDSESNGIKFENIHFVFTGFRDKEAQEKIEAEGGVVQNSVNAKTNYLIVKDRSKTSNKIKDAQEKGVTIMSQQELYDWINQ
jgi:DNA ligase (NAD+)